MLDTTLFTIQMLILGMGVGTLAAGLGLGGGILMVPAFITFVPGMDSHTAKGTSLFIVIFVAAYNAWQLNRGQKDKSYGLAATIALGSTFGAYAGTWITSLLSDGLVSLIFAVFVVVTGVRTLFLESKPVRPEDVRRNYTVAILIGIFMGLVSGATGVGGGGVLVPLALMAGIVSNARVVALSNLSMIATCIVGAFAHAMAPQTMDRPWVIGQVYLAATPALLLGSVAGAPIGRWLNHHLTLKRRRIVMGVLLLIIAARMLYRVLPQAG